MGQCYEQFSLEERCTLSRLSQAGKTIRQIAATMDRAPSTIMRELKRNRGYSGGLPTCLRRQAGQEPALERQSTVARCRSSGPGSHSAQARLVASPGVRSTEERKQTYRSSAMSRSIGSSMLRSGAPRTSVGVISCPEEKVSAGGADKRAVVRLTTSRGVCPSIGARPTSTSADSRVTGKGI